MIRKIVQSGNQILRTVSKPVMKLDKKVLALIQDLKDTLAVQTNPQGVGLASPQIGVNLRVFYAKYNDFELLAINPEVLNASYKVVKKPKKKRADSEILEGCLSLPHYYGPLKRANKITLKYQTLSSSHPSAQEGQSLINKVEDFADFNAQIVLHEIDHLDGIMFVDRLLEQKKKLYKLDDNDEWEEVEI